MATRPEEWRATRVNQIRINETFVPTGGVQSFYGTHFKGLGRVVIINDNNPGAPTEVHIEECIVCFEDDRLDASGIPVRALKPDGVTEYDQKWGIRSYRWKKLFRRVEFRHIPEEHGDYGMSGEDCTWTNCFFHDIGSQAMQERPEAQPMGGDAFNTACLHRMENCLVYRCGNPWGSRPSHALKWFGFQNAAGVIVPSLTDVEIVNAHLLHPGGQPHGRHGMFESYGTIFIGPRKRMLIQGGKIEYVKPEYPVVQIQGAPGMDISCDIEIPRGDNVVQLADIDGCKVAVKGKGQATIKVGHIIAGHFAPDVAKSIPYSQGYTQ